MAPDIPVYLINIHFMHYASWVWKELIMKLHQMKCFRYINILWRIYFCNVDLVWQANFINSIKKVIYWKVIYCFFFFSFFSFYSFICLFVPLFSWQFYETYCESSNVRFILIIIIISLHLFDHKYSNIVKKILQINITDFNVLF